MSTITITIGRVLLGLYFLLPGIQKIANYDKTIAYMQFHEIPFTEPLMWFSTAANIVGGALLITGRHVKWVAYACVLYVLIVNLTLHDFWTMGPDMVERETQNFFKNLGILAGLLVLAGQAPARPLSLSGLLRSDASATA
ncbi:MAG: DoxX family protein [Pseudomonadota bacterium]